MSIRIEWLLGELPSTIEEADCCVVERAELGQLSGIFVPIWKKVGTETVGLHSSRNRGQISLRVELWPDTGEVIFIGREMKGRDVLCFSVYIKELELAHSELPDPDDTAFDRAHDELMEQVARQLADSFLPGTSELPIDSVCDSICIFQYDDANPMDGYVLI